MAAKGGYDGTIRIDSRIDPKNFNQGIKNLTRDGKKFGALLANVGTGSSKALTRITKSLLGITLATGIASAAVLRFALNAMVALISVVGSSAAAFFNLEGNLTDLKDSLKDLRNAFAIAFSPLVEFALPYIKMTISWLIRLFNTIAMITGAILGQKEVWQAVEGGAAQAAKDAKALEENTKKAGKAAKGALAAFDELNVLQKPQGGVTTPEPTPALQTAAFERAPVLEETAKKVDEIKQKLATMFGPFISSLEKLWAATEPLRTTIWNALKWAWENILVPLWRWLIGVFIPALIGLLGPAFVLLGNILEGLGPILGSLWENFLKPAFNWLGIMLVKAIEWLTARLQDLNVWIDNNEKSWQAIVTVLAVIGIAILLLTSPIAAVIAIILGLIFIIQNAGKAFSIWKDLIKLEMSIIWNVMKLVINGIIDLINGMVSGIVSGINTVISAVNTVGSVIPGNPTLGYITAPSIPKLATGAVIPPNSQFLAVLGDQKSGRNLEAPENLIRQIFREEVGQLDTHVSISFNGSLGELVRMLKPVIDKENARTGGTLITSGAIT